MNPHDLEKQLERSERRANWAFWILIAVLVVWVAAEIWIL